MIKQIAICDRCKKETSPSFLAQMYWKWGSETNYTKPMFDLCTECNAKFILIRKEFLKK